MSQSGHHPAKKRRASARAAVATPAIPKRERRENTKARIVAAFGRIAARDGLFKVRLNQLMREAGVGKRQIYQYFGDLGGVAAEWSRTGIKDYEARVLPVGPGPSVAPGSPLSTLVGALVSYAENLRSNPVALAAIQGQLIAPTDLSGSLGEIRKALRREQMEVFLGDERLRDNAYVALYSVLYAAINYCALRGKYAPVFNGIDLSRPAGWQALIGMFRTVAALVDKGLGQAKSSRRARADSAAAARALRPATRGRGRAGQGRKSA